MAQNIFDATFDQNNKIDVNSFDWSHVNNLTTNFGRITPVFCELVPAKGSVRINPEFGLELMPMVFPVQTRMYARLNFFKVTLRSLWEDYADFIGNFRNDLEEPYLLMDEVRFNDFAKTCKLGDYLGMPTIGTSFKNGYSYVDGPCGSSGFSRRVYGLPVQSLLNAALNNSYTDLTGSVVQNTCSTEFTGGIGSSFLVSTTPSTTEISSDLGSCRVSFRFIGLNSPQFHGCHGFALLWNKNSSKVVLYRPIVLTQQNNGLVDCIIDNIQPSDFDGGTYNRWTLLLTSDENIGFNNYNFATVLDYRTSSDEILYGTFPFATVDSPDKQRLRAYRPRAYEAVYNAYYRDIRNNPFIVNGKPVYNKWLPTMAGGADTTHYQLHQCNWEKDFLTTAVPNPQQGANAPLVGLVMGDVVTQNEDGTTTVQKQTVLVDEDGSKYGVKYQASDDGSALTGVEYEPLSDKTPVTAINSYSELAALATEQGSGFTIETLRYVNAYQKFLELNMRKGFSYKQIMQGRWDINIRFDELLMPEFIGGISRELQMNAVQQNVDQQTETTQGMYAQALGSKAGVAGVYGYSDNNIEVFCDEESIIIGLLTVVPVPVYSQLLAKDWTYNGLLDHYQPEFDRIGFQPITYKELCPMNTFGITSENALNSVFGYQRPWYEYVQKYDSAHGLFRTQLKNFIMQRTFNGLPELGQQFLLVDPDTTNQVFAVTEYTDKIFGYVKFNATSRLPISRVAIPRLD